MGDGHAHAHAHREHTRTSRLLIVLALNVVLIAGLAAVGLMSRSLGVLAAAAEYVADAAAIVLIVVAHALERRGVGRHRRARPTEWMALLNGLLVSAVSITVIVEALQRLRHPDAVHGLPAMVVALVAMAVMGAGALLLVGDDDLGVRSVLLDTAGDAAAAGAVAVASAVIWLSGGRFLRLDPLLALLVAVVVLLHAAKLLRATVHALRSHETLGEAGSPSGGAA